MLREKDVIQQSEKLVNSPGKDRLTDDFFNLLFMLGYAKGKKKKELVSKAKKIADKIPEYRGWPDNKQKFWNAESFGWEQRIDPEIRELIKKEINMFLKGKCIELGSGSCPYVNKSVIVDFSKNMLDNAPKSHKKILHDLNKKLPFRDCSFDSVSASFIIDYLDNTSAFFSEINRILKPKGRLMIVQAGTPITSYYGKHEKKFWKAKEILKLLDKKKFNAKSSLFKIGSKEIVLIEAEKKSF
jgi:SAM-dependent methyltransferase